MMKILKTALTCLVVGTMFGGLLNIARASTTNFNVGDTVEVTTNLNVRTGPGTSYPEITDPDYPGYAPTGTRGKILNGPVSADGYTWWEVDFGPGLYSGWSVEDGLKAVDTLSVSLSADPSGGTAPLNDVDLTAGVSGSASGSINYTFYCDRADSGTDITPGWAAKFDGVFDNPKTAVDVCDYSAAGTYTAKVIVERGSAPPAEDRLTIVVDPPDTLSVSLSADPSGGTAPLNDVDLTAGVSGSASGSINYTFYCDRADSGTDITPGWAAKFDGVFDNPKTAVDVCDYSAAGTYTAKVIVERGSAPPAEDRLTIVVDPPDTLSVSLSADPSGGTAPLNDVDLTAGVSGSASGSINYTFYCDRADSGTDITPGWAAKFDGVFDNPKTAVDVCDYSAAGTYTAKVIVERGSAPPAEDRLTIVVDPPDTLSVSLSADPSGGTAPLNDVDLTAGVSGSASGSINYTFYCDRADSGTDITPGWAAKFDGVFDNPKTAVDVCDYSAAGTYTAKVIVERGSAPPAEDRLTIVVDPPDTLSVSLSADPSGGTAPLNDVDLTAGVSGSASGSINYTFYCDRADSGTDITPGWAAKFDGVFDNPKTAVDVCDYSAAGTYTAKVIVERGSAPPAEDRVIITVDPQGSNYSISPVYPLNHTTPSTIMQGGIAYRHFRLLDTSGSPIPSATITLSTGETAFSNASGYFTVTISADGLGGLGDHTASIQSVTHGGQTYTTDDQPSFTVQVAERRYSHAWGYGASTRLKGGISAGLIAYVQQENSGGLELALDESDPGITSDDVVLMKERYSDEIGAGGGVGIEKGVSIVILQVKGGASAVSERYIRTLGSTTARFPDPYESDDKKAQAIFLLASVLDSFQNAFPGKPFGIAFLTGALDLGAPYQGYIVEQQAGTGTKITPLQANVGADISLGLKRGGTTWKERILGFDLMDVGLTVLTLDTFTDYRDRGEIGLGSEAEFDFDFSALSWQIGDFRNKFAGTIGDRAKKIRLEIILDADTHEFKRLELSLTGEGNPYAFTDVLKEEVTVKAIIPAGQLTPGVLNQTVNVLRLLQSAQQTGSNPLQIGPSAMVNELNALLAPLGYVEYEVTVDDGAQTDYETSLGVTIGIDIELGPGLEVKKTRSLVRERGVFINGHPYVTESYQADSYVSLPGKGWWDLTTNALGGLWEYVKDFFSWTWQQVTSGLGWVIGTVAETVGGVVQGGAQVTVPAGTQLYAARFGSQAAAIQQTDPITVTAMGWVPTSTVGISSLGLSPAAATASGEGFVVGGIYEFQPYTLTMNPAATLVITYTDEAAGEVDESRIGMFCWNPEESNWQPMAVISDTALNTFTSTIDQLGTFALGYDATSPEISILAPTDGSTISNTLPFINALVVDKGTGVDPGTVEMRLDGQVVIANYITGTGQLLYLPSESLKNGTYTVTVSAADVMGNDSLALTTFIVEVQHGVYLPLILRNH